MTHDDTDTTETVIENDSEVTTTTEDDFPTGMLANKTRIRL